MSAQQFDAYSLNQNVYPSTALPRPGVTASSTVSANTVATGSIMLLVHEADSGTLASYSSPNNFSNPWQLINSVDYGSGGPKVRAWWKVATAADQAATTVYSVTGPSTAYHATGLWAIPPGYVDPGIAPTSTTATGLSDVFNHPAITTPNYSTHERQIAIEAGIVAASARAANNWGPGNLGGGTDPATGAASEAGDYYYQLDSAYANGLCIGEYFANPQLDGSTVPARGFYNQGSGTIGGVTYRAAPWAAMSILFYPFAQYQVGTTSVSAEVDTFSGSTVDTTKATVVSGAPTINASHQLVLQGGDQVTYNTVRNLKNSQVVVQVPQLTVTGTAQVQLQMGSQTWPSYDRIYLIVYLDPTTTDTTYNQPIMSLGVYDNNSYTGYGAVPYDPVNTAWWRIREMYGCLFFETSADGLTWLTVTEMEGGHGLLDDQLADMTVTLRVTGASGAASATFDNLNNPPGPTAAASIPSQRTYDWMGVSAALKLPWHGRDVLMGIADQGSTAAARAFNGVTLVNRNYQTGVPPEVYQSGTGYVTGEIFAGENHGCWVLSDGIPPGGRYVESVISDSSGAASTSTMCGGLLWCAQQGAKVINLSFGSSSDDPTFVTTFDYIAANYSCIITIAAGNEGSATIDFPARYSQNYSWIFSVTAFDELTGLRAPWSNYYTTVTGCAPGSVVNGVLPDGTLSTWSGTSAAAPHTMNVVGRLLTGGNSTVAQVSSAVKSNLRQTAAPQAEQGGGAFDLSLAAAALAPPPPAYSGTPSVEVPVTLGSTHNKRNTTVTAGWTVTVAANSSGSHRHGDVEINIVATAVNVGHGTVATVVVPVSPAPGTTSRSHIANPDGVTAVRALNIVASAQVGSLWSRLPREQQYDIAGASVRYIVQQLYSREIIHWDFPLVGAQVDWALSTPCSITGKLDPDHPDLVDLPFEPWATAIHMEVDGIIRASGILMPIEVDGEELSIQAIGPSTYLHGTPYLGAFQQMNPTVMTVLRELWNHAQGFDNSKFLGVQLPAGELPFTISGDTYVDQYGNIVEQDPYTMAWYDLNDCGDTWDSFAKMLPFDYQEATWWNATHTDTTNGINIGYPRLGTQQYNLKFATEENILATVPIAEVDDMYASSIFAKGAGEGSAMQYGYTNYWIDRRLRRCVVIDESSISDATVLAGIAYDETVRRLQGLVGIDQIVTDATHSNAPLGSYQPGDDITVEVSSPWAASQFGLYRVMGITYDQDADTATIKLRPSGSFRYGAQDGTGQ